jgi:hypothetical protein
MSLWYAAHLLMYVKRKNKSRGRIPVWENIVLFKAESEEAAIAKALERGKQDEGDDGGTFRWAGEPATWVFAGIRKLTLCEDSEKRPLDGTEISYTEMEIDSEESLADLVAGKSKEVLLTEQATESPENNLHDLAELVKEAAPGMPVGVLAAVDSAPKVPTAWVDELEEQIAEGRRPAKVSNPFVEAR